MKRLLACLAAVLILAAPAARAQPTPYQADLLRLSEILGALGYIDRLCDAPDPDVWRRRMQAIIAAQKMPTDDRRLYVDVFNRGHRTFASVHRTCTEQTRFVRERYLQEGVSIADRIEARFGGGLTARP